MDLRHSAIAPATVQEARLTTVPPRREPAAGVIPVSGTPREDAYLSDLDMLNVRPPVPEGLRALDEFTPHAGDRPR
jgi:hypothetical protein